MLESKNQLGGIILIFITVIVGVTLISALGDQIYENVNLRTIDNLSIDVSSAAEGGGEGNFTVPTEIDFTTGELVSFTELRMFNGTAATQNTDYRINLTIGGLTMLDTVFTSEYNGSTNTTYADFVIYPDLYVRHSISRTILNTLILIFVVLGMVVWVYAMVRKIWLDQI